MSRPGSRLAVGSSRKKPRLADPGSGQDEPLRLSAGQLAGRIVGAVAQADQLQGATAYCGRELDTPGHWPPLGPLS